MPALPVWRLFHRPTFALTLLTPPSPENSEKPRSAYGHMMTPESSCGMPRKKYAFTTSTPPVTVTAPGFASPAWACTGAAAAAITVPTSRQTTDARRATLVNCRTNAPDARRLV